MYTAIVARLESTSPIKGADRIKCGLVLGHQVILGVDRNPGELGIFLGPDGQLSELMTHENNLYRKGHGVNADPNQVGYLEGNRRIRVLKMKQVESEGMFLPLDSVKWTGVDPKVLVEGYEFTELNQHPICGKYFSQATQARIKGPGQPQQPRRQVYLQEHYDTPQLRYNISRVPEYALLHFTEKLHGTSGRTGRILADTILGPWQQRWNRFARWAGLPEFPLVEYIYCSGTRRVNLDPEKYGANESYDGATFRQTIHEHIRQRGLRKGETVYYEIVGFDERGRRIMPAHHLHPKEQKDLVKLYGTEEQVYRYGCKEVLVPPAPNDGDTTPPDLTEPYGNMFKVYVYRITIQDEDLKTYDLPWELVKKRCERLGLDPVPEVHPPILYRGDAQGLDTITLGLADGPSTLDQTHIREGVCVRVESGDMWKSLKRKGFTFNMCEDRGKDHAEYVDTEDVA